MLTGVGQADFFLPELVCPSPYCHNSSKKKVPIESCNQESSRTNILLKLLVSSLYIFLL